MGSENRNVEPTPSLLSTVTVPAVSLSKRLHDGETQARSARILRIGFSLVEDFFEKLFGDSRTVVADPALNGTFRAKFPCPDDNLSAWRVLDCVGDQVLKDPPQQTGVCIDDQVVGHLVDQLVLAVPATGWRS